MAATITLFLVLMIPLIWSPGPNNVMCATVGAKQGTAGSVPFIVGLNLPILVYALLTGLGLTAVLASVPKIATIFTIVGSIYVSYLGFKLISASSDTEINSVQYGFKSGFIISSLNFKVVTVLIVMYSQFLSSEILTSIILALAFVVVCIAGHFLWNIVGQISSQLLKNTVFIKAQNIIYGVMLLAVGLWMLLPALKSVVSW